MLDTVLKKHWGFVRNVGGSMRGLDGRAVYPEWKTIGPFVRRPEGSGLGVIVFFTEI
jgi:hypothetical protein